MAVSPWSPIIRFRCISPTGRPQKWGKVPILKGENAERPAPAPPGDVIGFRSRRSMPRWRLPDRSNTRHPSCAPPVRECDRLRYIRRARSQSRRLSRRSRVGPANRRMYMICGQTGEAVPTEVCPRVDGRTVVGSAAGQAGRVNYFYVTKQHVMKFLLAEREGFEPPVRLPVLRISSAARSTTLPPLRAAAYP